MQVADELGYLISIQRTIQTNSTRILTSCKYGGQRWRWRRWWWGNEGWDGWNFINRVCSIQSIIFDPPRNKMLATRLDCLIGSELSEPSRAKLILTERISRSVRGFPSQAELRACSVRLGSLPSLDIILDICNSIQWKVSTCENKIGLREKKTFMKKSYRSPN